MPDTLAYSLEEMQNILDTAVKYKNNYKDSLEKLVKEIDILEVNMQTDESNVYSLYKEKFISKLPELNNATSMMESFINTLELKIEELKNSTESVEDSFF